MRILLLILIAILSCLPLVAQDKSKIEIYERRCEKCAVFAYLDSKYFDPENMQKLAEELTKKYKDNVGVAIHIFDDRELIDAFVEGKREFINITSDRRAFFVHSAECGDLLFYKPDRKELKVIRLSWRNTEKCNKPFGV